MTKYVATPEHDMEFMHLLRPVQSHDYESLNKLMVQATSDFMYVAFKPTGEPFPKTIVFPEVRWKIEEIAE